MDLKPLQGDGKGVGAGLEILEFVGAVLIGVGAERSAVQRIAGEFHGNSGHAGRGIVLHRRDGSANCAGLSAGFLGGSVLREDGSSREQQEECENWFAKPRTRRRSGGSRSKA